MHFTSAFFRKKGDAQSTTLPFSPSELVEKLMNIVQLIMALDSHPLLWVHAGVLCVLLSPHKEFFPVCSTCGFGVSPLADPLSGLGVT